MGNLVLGSGSSAPYQISNSLLNDTDTDSLYMTPTVAGDTKTWSYSTWIKRGTLDGYDTIIRAIATDASGDWSVLRFEGVGNRIWFYDLPGGVSTYDVKWEPRFRDRNHWYHILLVYDTTQVDSSDRLKLYVDGELQFITDGTLPPLNYTGNLFNDNRNTTYVTADAANCCEGHTAESIFLGDVAATPEDFGEWHPESSEVWRPRDPGSVVATGNGNSFWYKYDPSSLGADYSGNGNTASLVGLTGALNSKTDSPTNNYCTLNGSLNNANVIGQDGLSSSHSGGNWDTTYGSMAVDSGKWYFESKITTLGARNYHRWGICKYNQDPATYLGYSFDSIAVVNQLDGKLYTFRDDVGIEIDASFTNVVVGDIMMVALDLDAGTVWFGKNGSWYGDPVAGTGDAYGGLTGEWLPAIALYGTSAQDTSFSEDAFTYTPPTGFNAWEAKYYEAPPVKDPTDYYQSLAYVGDGSASRAIPFTNSTDFAMFKTRTNTNPFVAYDSIRGAQFELQIENSSAETSAPTGLLSFDTTGFTVGTDVYVNQSGQGTVSYSWTKSPSAGFDIQTYAGTGVAQNINHNLGVAPKMIIVKSLSTGQSWFTYHEDLGQKKFLYLDTASNAVTSTVIWNNTYPTASVFSVGASSGSNASGQTYMAYLFADVRGTSKVFSYDGNGSTDGTFVHCGFRPQFIMIKNADVSVDWVLFDDKRDIADENYLLLEPNIPNAEETLFFGIQITKNGFKIRNTDGRMNTSAVEYVGIALASAPTELMNNGAL